VADVGNHNCIWFNNSKGDATFANSGFYNNVCVNGGGNSIHPNVDTEANVNISSGDAPATFNSYKPNSANNDYTLKQTDTVLKDRGCSNCGVNSADLKSVTTTDNVGFTQSGAWDIGAYEFNTFNATNTLPAEALPSDSEKTPSEEISLSLPDPPSQLKILTN
jgi:predicted carbohydrate-binding protein with CBM5 and CBM33 domain